MRQIGRRWEEDAHFANSGGDGSASGFDGDDGIESSNGGLEGNEGGVLVGKDAKIALLDAEADAGRDDVLCGEEPVVRLGGLIWEGVRVAGTGDSRGDAQILWSQASKRS
jgi:hypothetical protein